MRTSNKILLGTFLTAIMVLALIHISLYAKFKSGSYTTIQAIREDHFNHHILKNVNKIDVSGLEDVNIYPSDTARFEIEKSERTHLRFEIKAGVLIIRGDSTIHKPGEADEVLKSYEQVNIYLPIIEKITANNSTILIRGTKDSSQAKSFDVDLQHECSFQFHDDNDREEQDTYTYFKKLTIRAESSYIRLGSYSSVADMNLVMKGTDFSDNSGRIEKLRIQLDSACSFNLRGDNLQRAEIVK